MIRISGISAKRYIFVQHALPIEGSYLAPVLSRGLLREADPGEPAGGLSGKVLIGATVAEDGGRFHITTQRGHLSRRAKRRFWALIALVGVERTHGVTLRQNYVVGPAKLRNAL
jgi:hypothetical protein